MRKETYPPPTSTPCNIESHIQTIHFQFIAFPKQNYTSRWYMYMHEDMLTIPTAVQPPKHHLPYSGKLLRRNIHKLRSFRATRESFQYKKFGCAIPIYDRF